MDIQLTLINDSHSDKAPQIVIFQKNLAADAGQFPIAWKVVAHLDRGDRYSFCFPEAMQLGVTDSFGNALPPRTAMAGNRFQVVHADAGDTIELMEDAANPDEIALSNQFPTGALSASLYRNGKVLARADRISPNQQARFRFAPAIWITTAWDATAGQVIATDTPGQVSVMFSPLGMASADIVLLGSGDSTDPQPFSFSLENVVLARQSP